MYRCSTSTDSSLWQSFEWPRQLRGCRMSTGVASTSIRNRETSKIYLHHQLRVKAVFGCHNTNLSSPTQHKSVEPCHPLRLSRHAPIGSRFTTKTTTDDGSAVAVRGFRFTRSPRYLCLNPEMGNYQQGDAAQLRALCNTKRPSSSLGTLWVSLLSERLEEE